MSTCGEVGSDVHAFINQGARHQTGRAQVENTLQRLPTFSGRDGSSTSSAVILFCFTAGTFILHASPLCRQGAALASTRQVRSQGSVSVRAHRTEGVTGFEERKETNGVGGGIEVGVGNGDGNGVGGGNGDVKRSWGGDGTGAGTGMEVEVNEGTRDGNGDGSGDGDGDGDP